MEYSPSLANKVALASAEMSVADIAGELLRYIAGANDAHSQET
jgi:hypothetical protein